MISHAEYWDTVQKEVSGLNNRRAPLSPLDVRSTDFSDVHGVELNGIGGHQLFAYHSVPRGDGPFPAILMAPGYASVVAVPPHERRRDFVVLALCARGQRLADKTYAASYPGLLTDQISDPHAYPYRGIVADTLTAFDFLTSRPEVAPDRIGISSGGNGGDVALVASALRPAAQATLVGTPMLFRDAANRFPNTSTYPLEEFNDYLRGNPSDEGALRDTISLFDPIGLIDRVQSTVRISCSEADETAAMALLPGLKGRGSVNILSGKGFLDHAADEAWLKAALTA